MSHELPLQTVPQPSSKQNSTRPSLLEEPPTSLTSPLVHSAAIKNNINLDFYWVSLALSWLTDSTSQSNISSVVTVECPNAIMAAVYQTSFISYTSCLVNQYRSSGHTKSSKSSIQNNIRTCLHESSEGESSDLTNFKPR